MTEAFRGKTLSEADALALELERTAESRDRAILARVAEALSSIGETAETEHIFLGAGDGPCVILMAGSRSGDWKVRYPVSELAARYGASADEETSDPRQAYARFEPSRRERPSYWDRLPWS